MLVRLHHILVVALHKIDLDTLGSPAAVGLQNLFHIGIKWFPQYPEDDSDILLPAVFDQFFYVDVRVVLQNFGGRFCPAFVENHVFDLIVRGKIDVVLVSGGIEARFKIHSKNIVSIVPIPGHFARLDPFRIFEYTGFGQLVSKVALHQIGVLVADDKHPPGKISAGGYFGNIIRLFTDDFVSVCSASRIPGFQHIRRKFAYKPIPAVTFEEHTGVTMQRSFCHEYFSLSRQIDQQGHAAKTSGSDIAQLNIGIPAFVVRVGCVFFRKITGCSVGKEQIHFFVQHLIGFTRSFRKTVSHTIVVDPERQTESFPEL